MVKPHTKRKSLGLKANQTSCLREPLTLCNICTTKINVNKS